MAEATCTAPVNIAAVKYWGKRDTTLILPTNSSLSVTLSQDDLKSLTSAKVIVNGSKDGKDRLWLNGVEEAIKSGGRTDVCLKEMKKLRAEIEAADPTLPVLSSHPLHLASVNNFPTAAGLASSASGLSALIYTLATLYSLASHGVSLSQLSRIARQGSGSACRSLFGGFVAWDMGVLENGEDSGARQVATEDSWDLEALVCVVSDKKKGTASTAGMQKTIESSELLQERIKKGGVVDRRMAVMEKAIKEKDFATFATETMRDSNQFHAVCLDTFPPIFYLNDVSRAIIALVGEINRAYGEFKAAYTFDAGPNAVLYCEKKEVELVLEIVKQYFPQEEGASKELDLPAGFNKAVIPIFALGSVSRIIHTRVGDGPRVLDNDSSLLNGEGWPVGVVNLDLIASVL